MCGISGYIGKKTFEQPIIHQTLGLMRNRGPDHQDYRYIKQNGTNIYLLHSRLSIIDLDKRANQPFTIGDCTLVFNGEIYNYIELRKQLERDGITFKTDSDTEVLLQSYLMYGEECINDFEGMWSFAIYDKNKEQLFLSRDRFAEKPLYYFQAKDGIFFGSEIKFIKSLSGSCHTVNQLHLFRYLVNGYKSLYKTRDTFYAGIQEVEYATNIVIKDDLKLRVKRYWMPVYSPQDMTIKEAIEGFRNCLIESVKLRLRADVPLAFCLSGGVDSTALVSIASKCFNYDVTTFSIIDSDERYNERKNIQTIIDDLGCKHFIIEILRGGFFERLTELIQYHDAPIYTISYYIQSFLSESISSRNYRVVCSGTAADELITGYYDHFNLHLYEMRLHRDYQKYLNDWNKKVSHFVRNPYLQNPELYFKQRDFRDHIYLNKNEFAGFLKMDFHEAFIEQHYSDALLRNRMLNELFHEVVPAILHEDDLNSMRCSIENRSPYLDTKLFEFAYSIPDEHLIQGGYGKYILREAVKGILNDTVRQDRCKKGFNASIHSLIDLADKKNREFILDESKIYEYIDRDKVERLLEKDTLPNSYSKFLFNFLSAKIFLSLN